MNSLGSAKWIVLIFILVSCTLSLPQERYAGRAFAVAQQNIPDWAKANNVHWASLPQGISLDGTFNAQNQHQIGSAIDLRVSSYDLVWSEGYYLNSNYVGNELKTDPSGATINPANVWVKFNLKDAQGTLVQTASWITAGNSFASALFTPTFIDSQQQGLSDELNAILIFACDQKAQAPAGAPSGAAAYNCNGVDGKDVVVLANGQLASGSGRGSWMLVSVGAVSPVSGTPTVPPFQPGSLGSASPSTPPFQPTTPASVPPFQPGALGSSAPSSTTGSSSGTTSSGSGTGSTSGSSGTSSSGSTTTSGGGIIPPLNQPPPCIIPNNPPGCV